MNVVNLFDFDGVLASPLEEAMFQLPPTRHDEDFIKRISYKYDLNLDGESRSSARYICMQIVLFFLKESMGRGPEITKAHRGAFHIITARCDRYASLRLHQFVAEQSLTPIKIMQLDHLPKGQMLQNLLQRHPETHYRFYDDNMRHIDSALRLKDPRLSVFHVDNDLESFYKDASNLYHNRILEQSE